MAKTRIKLTKWDVVDHLKTPEAMLEYLRAALDEDDPVLVATVLGDIARAQGMTSVAEATGLSRESLYKSLSPEGNPEFATIFKVLRALGFKLDAGLRVTGTEAEAP